MNHVSYLPPLPDRLSIDARDELPYVQGNITNEFTFVGIDGKSRSVEVVHVSPALSTRMQYALEDTSIISRHHLLSVLNKAPWIDEWSGEFITT